MRLDGELENQRRGLADPRAALEDALALAFRIEQLLNDASSQCPDNDAFRVRLARAHTLSLVDQLSELMGTRASSLPPTPSGIRECAPKSGVPSDDDALANGRRRP